MTLRLPHAFRILFNLESLKIYVRVTFLSALQIGSERMSTVEQLYNLCEKLDNAKEKLAEVSKCDCSNQK
jgi:hypothetical protein